LRPEVAHEPLTASWQIKAPWNASSSAATTSDWGTARMNACRILEVGLNKGIPVVYDTDPRTDTKTKNIEESLAAQEKLQALQARFSEWIWEDPDRATRLAARYNELFNSVVARFYDGTHLSFPAMSSTWANGLYPWHRDFVWRMAQSRSALCAHPVGAGKTTTEIAGAMTLKRLGLISKAAIVVPNHLLEQITAEAQRLYPSARVLMVSRDDLSTERRKLFAARVAAGDYDFVVMTHSGLGAIGVHPETERQYLAKRMADYRQALLDVDEKDAGGRYSIKRLETAVEKMTQHYEELLDKPRDEGVTFEQLGISYLIIDESHLFKNLGLPTNIQGLQVKASKRATDLEMKLRWLEDHNEGRPFASFFTATPLSNTMVEAYVLQWDIDSYEGLLMCAITPGIKRRISGKTGSL
jgi:N12 class adenine-specific DNA methylase